MPPVTMHAPAKVNLALSVGPPEAPGSAHAGWHPIATWMAAIDLCDEVTVEPLEGGTPSTLSISFADDAPRPEPVTWPVERDLAWRAHRALESHLGHALSSRLTVLKRIPTGAGLGGGSSDAATTLIALDRAHGLGLSCDILASIGRTLGSDVPFFIDEARAQGQRAQPRPALVTGFGERVERLEIVRGEMVLIVPPFGCATPEVYRTYDMLGPSPLRAQAIADLAHAHTLDPGALFNDLAAAARTVAPGLDALMKNAARAAGLPVHLTGSGSALFILTPPERARALAARLAAEPDLHGCALVATFLGE